MMLMRMIVFPFQRVSSLFVYREELLTRLLLYHHQGNLQQLPKCISLRGSSHSFNIQPFPKKNYSTQFGLDYICREGETLFSFLPLTKDNKWVVAAQPNIKPFCDGKRRSESSNFQKLLVSLPSHHHHHHCSRYHFQHQHQLYTCANVIVIIVFYSPHSLSPTLLSELISFGLGVEEKIKINDNFLTTYV